MLIIVFPEYIITDNIIYMSYILQNSGTFGEYFSTGWKFIIAKNKKHLVIKS